MEMDRKRKEVTKRRYSKRMFAVICANLCDEKVEVIVNSVLSDLNTGFGRMISTYVIGITGKEVKEEAIEEATRIFGSATIPVGKFVTTSAGSSKEHKYVIHCVCPTFDGFDKSRKVLIDLVTDIFLF